MTITFAQLTHFDGIEHRGFPISDMWLGPCPLLAAMIADESVADMWERNAFDALHPDEVEDAMQRSFNNMHRKAMAHGHNHVWVLNITHHLAKELS